MVDKLCQTIKKREVSNDLLKFERRCERKNVNVLFVRGNQYSNQWPAITRFCHLSSDMIRKDGLMSMNDAFDSSYLRAAISPAISSEKTSSARA